MTTPHEPQHPDDLSGQVARADAAVQREAAEVAAAGAPVRPADRRAAAVVALVAFAATLWLSRERLRADAPDPMVLRDGLRQGIETVRSNIDARWDSTGALPATLSELGLGDLPLSYTASGNTYRLVGVTEAGDTITYDAPARPAPEAAR